MLNQEREFFESHRQDWLVHYADRFVLVKGKRLVGVFSTIDEALSEGTRLFGLNSFLIRQVKPSEEEIYVPALTLGLLSATSSSSK